MPDEIFGKDSLKLIGTLPAEFQSYIIYTAAPMTNAEQPETAKAFIRFLASPRSKDAFAAAGAN
jgi:molybdate transport system substrate-binding protein